MRHGAKVLAGLVIALLAAGCTSGTAVSEEDEDPCEEQTVIRQWWNGTADTTTITVCYDEVGE